MKPSNGWITRRFDQFAAVLSGATPSTTTSSYWGGSIVWVTPADLSKLKTPYLDDSAKRVSGQGLKACSASLLPARSIVISSRAPIGYVAIPVVDFCTNQGCKSLALRSGFDPEFVYYNIVFNIEKLKQLGEGTTFAEISKKAISTIALDFPEDKVEQSKIAEILSTTDRAIEQTDALIIKHQRIKAGLMQDLLTRGIDEQGNLRSEETHEFSDSPLGRVPAEWGCEPLGEHAIVKARLGWKGLMAHEYLEEGCIFLSTPNLKGPQIDFSNVDYISRWRFDESKEIQLRRGDVLIVKDGSTLGIVNLVKFLPGPATVNGSIAVVRPKSTLQSEFLFQYVRGESFQELVDSRKSGLGVPHLFQADLRNFLIPLPGKEEQKKIAAALAAEDEILEGLQIDLSKQQLLKAALMQDLVTGKKRVTSLLDPAEAA